MTATKTTAPEGAAGSTLDPRDDATRVQGGSVEQNQNTNSSKFNGVLRRAKALLDPVADAAIYALLTVLVVSIVARFVEVLR